MTVDILHDLKSHIRQMAPHVAEREEDQLLKRAAKEIESYRKTAEWRNYWIGFDNSDPPQLWVWRGRRDDGAEPWMRIPT